MANSIAQSNTVAMYDEIIQEADIKTGVSKSLPIYGKDDEDWQRANGTMWIPEAFNVEAQTGIDSTGSTEDLTDRMVPVSLDRAWHVKLNIGVKQLRDGRLTKEGKNAVSRALKNKVDTVCFAEMINRATMVVRSTTDFAYGNASMADTLLDDAGLSGFNRKMVLSIPHYQKIAETLAQSNFKDTTNLTAFEKLQIPPVAGFESMKADYRKNLAGTATTGLTVNGTQSHTVATYTDADENTYLDNRKMTLDVTGATALNAVDGDKLQIADVYALHPSTYETTGELRTFSVHKGAAGEIEISPAIIISGPDRNCDAAALNGAAITFLNTKTAAPSVFYAEDSVYLVPGRLPVASEVSNIEATEMVLENGIPVRFTHWWEPDGESLNIKALLYFDVAVTCPDRVGVILTNQS
jgi:hypothetical protein